MNSTKFKNCKNIKARVLCLLKSNPETRESDHSLIAHYYYNSIGADVLKNMTAIDLLTKLSFNKLPNFDSIGRVRRKLQVIDTTLMGVNPKKQSKNNKVTFKVNMR